MRAINCKTEYQKNPMGIDRKSQRLSWNCADGTMQTAYQVQIFRAGELLYDSGKVISHQMSTIVTPNVKSRDVLDWRVCLWDENDVCGEWNEESSYEMGLLQVSDWKARWICPEIELLPDGDPHCQDEMNRLAKAAWDGRKHKKNKQYVPHQPASYVRKRFVLKENGISRLYISACGVYEVFLNGQRVGDAVLTPGSSNYAQEIKYQVYDVSKLLQDGENELEIVVGDGWYRSTSGVDGDRCLYGEKLSVLAQLEVNGQPVVLTDSDWEASQDGPLAQNDMQQGEVYDARREGALEREWHNVCVDSAHSTDILHAENMVPIRKKESFTGKILTTPNGETIVDFGQNLAGVVEFTLEAKAGQHIQLIHGETLDENGNFTTENFQERKRHKEGGTCQTIFYTCKDGVNHYEPRFTIMGFRYVKIVTDGELKNAQFAAHAIYSDMEQTAGFTCGNELVNQLVNNALWSLKGNFCDIPTDCPTRERAGWTGDAGLYVNTGLRLMDTVTVYEHWLRQCRYGQYADGRVANIAPPNNRPGFMSKMLSASVGWGDACILVPYAIYQATGDVRVLEENYEMMQRWYAFLEKQAAKRSLKKLFAKIPERKYTFESGINYGEWCEPGTNPMQSMRNGNYDVANAYYCYSGRLLTEIADRLGHKEDAARYAALSESAGKAFIANFTEDGAIHSERQCQYVRPITFGLLDPKKEQEAAAELNRLVEKNGWHLNTGFLTTPDLCRVLAEHGYVETAYRLLLQEDAPGWLYEVKKGATTVWEVWDGINESGVPRESLNHYSYGAIVGWLIDGVCGIRYSDTSVTIKPYPHKSLRHAEAWYESPRGKIVSKWRYEGEELLLHVEIPCGVEAKVVLPDGREEVVDAGEHTFCIK